MFHFPRRDVTDSGHRRLQKRADTRRTTLRGRIPKRLHPRVRPPQSTGGYSAPSAPLRAHGWPLDLAERHWWQHPIRLRLWPQNPLLVLARWTDAHIWWAGKRSGKFRNPIICSTDDEMTTLVADKNNCRLQAVRACGQQRNSILASSTRALRRVSRTSWLSSRSVLFIHGFHFWELSKIGSRIYRFTLSKQTCAIYVWPVQIYLYAQEEKKLLKLMNGNIDFF